MLHGPFRAVLLGSSLLASLLVACGGSTPAAGTPGSGSQDTASDGSNDSNGASAEGSDGESDGEGSATAGPAKPSCDDGTCSPCGDALCPSGWYCDESAPGGPACGWLPECPSKASCACVKRAFSGCSCEDRAGSAHVKCG